MRKYIFEEKFLDYKLVDSGNGDGIVLLKEENLKFRGETHLGNYGSSENSSNIDGAKMAAVIYFMIARPEDFASTMFFRAMGSGGQYHEWFLFRNVLKKEGIPMPKELQTPINDLNFQVGYKGKKITFKDEGRSYYA